MFAWLLCDLRHVAVNIGQMPQGAVTCAELAFSPRVALGDRWGQSPAGWADLESCPHSPLEKTRRGIEKPLGSRRKLSRHLSLSPPCLGETVGVCVSLGLLCRGQSCVVIALCVPDPAQHSIVLASLSWVQRCQEEKHECLLRGGCLDGLGLALLMEAFPFMTFPTVFEMGMLWKAREDAGNNDRQGTMSQDHPGPALALRSPGQVEGDASSLMAKEIYL